MIAGVLHSGGLGGHSQDGDSLGDPLGDNIGPGDNQRCSATLSQPSRPGGWNSDGRVARGSRRGDKHGGARAFCAGRAANCALSYRKQKLCKFRARFLSKIALSSLGFLTDE